MRSPTRTPGFKLLTAIMIAAALAIPLFSIYHLVYDRQSQSETARTSIAEGWGGPQTIAGPLLVIPYPEQVSETVTEGGRQVVRGTTQWRELILMPESADIHSTLQPERRTRSIYDAVVYSAHNQGSARFRLPADLSRYGVSLDSLAFDRAELRFGVRDARGLYGNAAVTANGHPLALQPGKGTPDTNGSGFFAWLDAGALRTGPINAAFAFDVRGNGWLSITPEARDTRWTVTSNWPSPSFLGGFLPASRQVSDQGFKATWRVGNLALGKALVAAAPADTASQAEVATRDMSALSQDAGNYEARVNLVTPVDLYSQVNRSVKYGFLFIGFTFLAFLMFDVVGGVKVSGVEYLLVGAGLVLFFVMLLAFAEVIGFAAAYLLAAAAIVGLLTAYSAAVLRTWRRAAYVAGLLTALYAVLYVLLSLEAYSLLIGSLLLFAALAAVMYLTRNLDWGGPRDAPTNPNLEVPDGRIHPAQEQQDHR